MSTTPVRRASFFLTARLVAEHIQMRRSLLGGWQHILIKTVQFSIHISNNYPCLIPYAWACPLRSHNACNGDLQDIGDVTRRISPFSGLPEQNLQSQSFVLVNNLPLLPPNPPPTLYSPLFLYIFLYIYISRVLP